MLIGSFAGALLVTSCENELKDVPKVSSKKVPILVDKSLGVEIIYSDSAVVKAKVFAPLMLTHKTTNPYYEMPKGVTVIFYDEKLEEKNRVTSDYAIRRENEKIIELRKNVVIRTKTGETIKSEEMFWNENIRRFYSNQMVTITSPRGDIGYGTGFESDENFNYTLRGGNGIFTVPEKAIK
ncbi:LPS export ABC transporter periplasmic protein LptC [Pedobacter sp. HMF7056]|uniref:LPS export ABC transporter periplasmic protein LptC n=1 Tax=Hufsiella ginkgonis TaxID=2695274 RepID=A0A7K1XTV2_9SPHI|nr:LPS export ABC transporter periplasmic protein LptC [Hufsiella ginkgonis]